MKHFGLIGYPLGHSMSPLIHQALFAVNGIDADYSLIEIPPQALPQLQERLQTLDGFNVTIPHKTAILPLTASLSPRAALFGAVNTVKNDHGSLEGHNTDCTGFLRAMALASIPLAGDVLVCGSGGVARMFAFEAVLAGADLTLAARNTAQAETLRREIAEKCGREITVVPLEQVSGSFDVLINATPVGMFPNADGCVVPQEQVRRCSAVFDAVYNPLETRLITYAKACGAKACNGLSMLVLQAAAAQEIWLGVTFTDAQLQDIITQTERELGK